MIAEMMNTYKNAPLYMCYQDRNLTYSIDEEFELWKLKAILIPLKSFEFDAEKFLQKNSHTELMDEFPFEKIDSTLYMLEVRNADEPFEFEQK